MTEKIVRIGGASGFWGDSSVACAQLVRRGQVDYLVFDYLAELTMSILSVARAKSPDAGYATDFVDVAMKSVIRDIAAKGIKVVSNAGGVNPAGCAAALAKLAEEAGVKLRIAIVEGDDVLPRIAELRAAGVREMYSGAELPQKILSANAYLGALPIARALAAGADVVITGRCVDSAVALGPLIHEFGWREDDYDRLAAGSLAGHIVECGCQATGRPVHRLGVGAALGRHRLSDPRVPRRRQLRRDQGAGHRRPGEPRGGGGADALRNGRPGRLPAARRGVRFHRRRRSRSSGRTACA